MLEATITLTCRLIRSSMCLPGLLALSSMVAAADDRMLGLEEIGNEPASFEHDIGASGTFTWRFPAQVEEYVLPISAGVLVDGSRTNSMRWLREGSPWTLSELPVLGLRYGDQLIVVIVPWPQYAELIFDDRPGIRFLFPEGRHGATPARIVAMRRTPDPLEVARAFREWRRGATDIGGIPRPRTLTQKLAELNSANRLPGAPHLYLWGPALFCRHDVPSNKWIEFARALRDAATDSFGHRLVERFTVEQRGALGELAESKWPLKHLTVTVAGGIDSALSDPGIHGLSSNLTTAEVIQRSKRALAREFGGIVNPPESWGDGLSTTMLEALHDAGIERALLLSSDLCGRSPRPDVAALADKFGYLLGPYDSYHSVHSPKTAENETWETAQFDLAAYEHGRILNADGSGNSGFRGRGYHFAPQAAWPYMRQRVNATLDATAFSAWFIDCDATAECFDDYSPEHEATRVDDINLRRQRLHWLEKERGLVVGSEGGSVLFCDVIHFGHGVHTPYIGHLDPAFRDPQSPYFLGRHWPPDTPEQSFKSVPLPPSLKTPYFDPTVRIPLYQAALGDEVIVTHHWSFDSLKFSNVEQTRELLEILYLVPPLYHLNRETWPKRRERILRHLAFWAPLHRLLAPAPLTRFQNLTGDRLVQRTTFETPNGFATITVNFDEATHLGFPPHSASVAGAVSVSDRLFVAREP